MAESQNRFTTKWFNDVNKILINIKTSRNDAFSAIKILLDAYKKQAEKNEYLENKINQLNQTLTEKETLLITLKNENVHLKELNNIENRCDLDVSNDQESLNNRLKVIKLIDESSINGKETSKIKDETGEMKTSPTQMSLIKLVPSIDSMEKKSSESSFSVTGHMTRFSNDCNSFKTKEKANIELSHKFKESMEMGSNVCTICHESIIPLAKFYTCDVCKLRIGKCCVSDENEVLPCK